MTNLSNLTNSAGVAQKALVVGTLNILKIKDIEVAVLLARNHVFVGKGRLSR
jgi:hypothetical protein